MTAPCRRRAARVLGGSIVVTAAADATPTPASSPADSDLVRAARGLPVQRTPVWFMRQAGRSLPEYRALRAGTRMLEACQDPDLVTEITLQPVRRHGVDAGIFFSDIVVPIKLAGVDVEIVPGRGPVLGSPIRTAADVDALEPLDPAALAPITEAVQRTVAELGEKPLIGFAGAPFTLAAYLVAGRPSKDHLEARRLMRAHPESWDALMRWAADVTGRFLRAQVEEGASAAQLFDSWAGSLPLEQYREHVAPASRRALDAVEGVAGPEAELGDAAKAMLAQLRTALGFGQKAPRSVPVGFEATAVAHD